MDATITNFLRNDLAWALRHFLDNAKGTFGIAAASEMEPSILVLAARRQPLSLSVYPNERQAPAAPMDLGYHTVHGLCAWLATAAPFIVPHVNGLPNCALLDDAGLCIDRYSAAALPSPGVSWYTCNYTVQI